MKRILIIILLLINAYMLNAQDINFSQFYEMPLLRNPALAGLYDGDYRVTGAYRNQWASVTTPYVSQGLGLEGKMAVNENSDNYFAFGIQMTNDMAGDSKMGRTQALPVFTFHKSLSSERNTYLSLGFIGGFVQQRFDPTNLKFDDQFVNGAYSELNPTRQTFTNTNLTYFDGSVGMCFSDETDKKVMYYLGASYFHFNQPKVAFAKSSDIRLNKKIMLNGGISFPMTDYNRLLFYVDYFTQGGNKQTQGGLMYRMNLTQDDEEGVGTLFSIGSFIRWNDAIIPMVKFNVNRVGVGFTYDVNVSKLKAASESRGGFEVTMSYQNFLNIGKSSLSRTRCPVRF